MELETVAPAVEDARTRRADLHQILIELEAAIAAAAPGREDAWTEQVRATLDRLSEAFTHHVEATEGPDGERRRRRPAR